MAKVLIIDNDLDMCEVLAVTGRLRGHEMICASDAEEAISIAKGGFKPDAVIVDIYLNAGNGIDVLRQLRQNGVEGFAIVFSGFIQTTDLSEWERLKIFDSLLKPASMPTLWAKIEDAAMLTQQEGSLCDFLKGLIRRNEEAIGKYELASA